MSKSIQDLLNDVEADKMKIKLETQQLIKQLEQLDSTLTVEEDYQTDLWKEYLLKSNQLKNVINILSDCS